jgi:acyl-CoA synthetase (AMP-forming)/AMP-acid ligase II
MTALRVTMADLDSALWRDPRREGLFIPFVSLIAGTDPLGCPRDTSWMTLMVLLLLVVLRGCWQRASIALDFLRRVGKSLDMKADISLTVDEVPAARECKQSKILGPPKTMTDGFLHVEKRRSIVTFPELIRNDDCGDVALLGSMGQTKSVTFKDLQASLSGGLADALPDGLRYAISMPAGTELACVLLACMHRGIAAPLDPTMTREELLAAYEQLKINVVICSSGQFGSAARAAGEYLGLPVLECKQQSPSSTESVLPTLSPISGTLPAPMSSQCWEPRDIQRSVLLLRTSGTTSKGKVVPFAFQRLALAAQYNAACIDLKHGDVCLSMMPLYHIAGISVNLLPSIFAGSKVLLLEGLFNATHFLQQIERQDKAAPTWYFAVPSVHAAVLAAADELRRPLKHRLRLVRSAGAALEVSLGHRLIDLFDAAVTPCYGMTEACEITCPPSTYRLERAGSVGPAMTCRIKVDVSNDPQGCTGEICVQGDLLMQSYEWDGPKDEDPNLEAWTDDGFLRTGDVGYLDEDGWVFLTGRSKEMINRGGETLSPYEVEEALKAHPHVSFALAFAAPHESLGECVAVACVLREGASVQDAGLDSLHAELERQGCRRILWPEVLIQCPKECLPMTRTKKYIRAGLAAKLGLTRDLLKYGGTAFRITSASGKLELAPEAESSQIRLLADSMQQLRRVTSREREIQEMTNALYGISMLNVMLHHWLPHDISSFVMPDWAAGCLTIFRSDKVLMEQMFVFGGLATAQLEPSAARSRIMCLAIIYVLMGWPTLFEATSGFATFHRWFILYLILYMIACEALDKYAPKGLRPLAAVSAFMVAPAFTMMPDSLGKHLYGVDYLTVHDTALALFLNSSFYWSVAHKIYWFGFFVVGRYCGPLLSNGIRDLPADRLAIIGSTPVRILALLTAFLLAVASVSLDVPYDPNLEGSFVADWPQFFNYWYPLKLMAEWAQILCIVIGVQQGNQLLRVIGAGALGTFALHMILDLDLEGFASSPSSNLLTFAQSSAVYSSSRAYLPIQ